ncbi:16S rRNA (guanine(966)-N(2))-methyltransferase RsmD [bacterium]|nr:16S rRNA (guanine(966)-N(2))-methyltransferase RsmD [bacterium]
MSQPRIISGKARGIRLQDVPGDITRPITDRVKEAVFNIFSSDILDSCFLDLFGGTGSVGIEALSRGAHSVTFVDLNSAAINIIKANLRSTRLEANARVHQMDAFRFLDSPQNEKYDYIYIAPPQYKEMWIKALQMVDQRLDLLTEDGWVVVQIHPVELADVTLSNLHEFDRREYGSTLVLFYARNDLT